MFVMMELLQISFCYLFTGHHANQRAANIQSDKQKGNPRNIYIEGEALQFLIIIKLLTYYYCITPKFLLLYQRDRLIIYRPGSEGFSAEDNQI